MSAAIIWSIVGIWANFMNRFVNDVQNWHSFGVATGCLFMEYVYI